MIKGTLNKDIYKVVCGGEIRYVDDSIENIYDMVKNSTKKWSIRRISVEPTPMQKREMRIMEDEIDLGSFECYSTCGGCYTSQFTYMMDDLWYVTTIENINPTNIAVWCIPTDKNIYECIGQEEYLFWECDLSQNVNLPKIETETYEHLVMNMSE